MVYHHHHVALVARISLTLSRHSSLSFIALGRSSGQHPVSSHKCWMYVRAGRPAFARSRVGVHKSIHIHAETYSPIMTNEHTSLEKYTSHTLFSKGLRNGCERVVCKRWVGDWTDCNILTPSSSVFSSTSFSFCWAAQPGVLRAQALCWELVLTTSNCNSNSTNWPQLTRGAPRRLHLDWSRPGPNLNWRLFQK